jgi:hypothetical protein
MYTGMNMQQLPMTRDNLVAVRVSGTLTTQEIDHFKTLVREVIEQFGEVRMYFEMQQFDGWQIDSFLENAFFDIANANRYTKVAMVGEKSWQAWITRLVDVVKRGEVRYFDMDKRQEAAEWVQHGSLRTMEG